MVLPTLRMLLLNDDTILTSLIPLRPRKSRTNRKTRNTRNAGMNNEMAVSQFFFRKISFSGASETLTRKSIINIPQMPIPKYSSILFIPQTNSITSKTSQTNPKKIIGPSRICSTDLSNLLRSLILSFFIL